MARTTRGAVAREQAAQATPVTSAQPVQLSSPPTTPAVRNGNAKSKTASSKSKKVLLDESPAKSLPITPKSNRKRARAAVIKDEDVNELPHNLGAIPDLPSNGIKSEDVSPAKKLKKTPNKTPVKGKSTLAKQEGGEDIAKATATPKKSSKKDNAYGLTPGKTPYPNWPHPTAEECEDVARLLSSLHGEVVPPKTIPTPSLTSSGCGEVPSVLDALIRTRLSAATSGTNSSRAFAGLVSKFGVLKDGIGKGSVDWNKVRQADTKDVFEAIKSGGLADVKSKDIKNILQMVWEENQARRDELVSSGTAPGSMNEASEEKKVEIARADENVLSLDHLHLVSNEDAFNALTKYPGIGPKTASCVLLFCLQRPSFAVDTHVFRLCKWLGWVPPPGDPAGLAPGAKGTFAGPTRESTFSHCEVRIPDNLKYPLHQLLIKHGKTCPRCRAITGESSEGWEKGCVIDHLVQRTGGRKDIGASPAKGANGRTGKSRPRAKAKKYDESDLESSEMSDLGSEEESELSSD